MRGGGQCPAARRTVRGTTAPPRSVRARFGGIGVRLCARMGRCAGNWPQRRGAVLVLFWFCFGSVVCSLVPPLSSHALTHSPALAQTALHYLASLPPPLSTLTELQLLSPKTFGKCDCKCRRVRQLHCAPPAAHTHDTVFFAVVDWNAHACPSWGGAALIALDALLSSKSAGFARCQVASSSSSSIKGTEVNIGMRLRQLLQEPSCQARSPLTSQADPAHSLPPFTSHRRQWLLQDVAAAARSL
jgi:hypothetical protein